MNLKNISILLHKLGILRVGAKSWSGDAKKRPMWSIMSNIMDDEKDLIHKEDIKKVKAKVTNFDQKNKTNYKLKKFIYILSIVLGVLFLLIFLLNSYFGFRFFANLLIRGFSIITARSLLIFNKGSLGKTIMFLGISFIVSFFSMAAIGSEDDSIKYKTIMNPVDLVDIAIILEEDLLLEDVSVVESTDKTLEIRMKAPNDISQYAVISASTYIFKYIQPYISQSFDNIRIILTINYIDSYIIESNNKNIQLLINGDIDEQKFAEDLKIINMVK